VIEKLFRQRFIAEQELYSIVQQLSSRCERVLWVASPFLGRGAHEILSQDIVSDPPEDRRFLFGLTAKNVRRGAVDPYEVEYLQSRFGRDRVRANESFHAKVYIFDEASLVSSANFSRTAFERNIEVGVLLGNKEADKVREFYERLWKNSHRIAKLDDYKGIWNKTEVRRRGERSGFLGGTGKIHTKMTPWDEQVANWIVPVNLEMKKASENKIVQATDWHDDFIGTIRRKTFNGMRLGHRAFLADYVNRRNENLSVVRVTDKRRVRTGEGSYHFSYEKLKGSRSVRINKLADLLRDLKLLSRRGRVEFEKKLTDGQVKRLTEVLSKGGTPY